MAKYKKIMGDDKLVRLGRLGEGTYGVVYTAIPDNSRIQCTNQPTFSNESSDTRISSTKKRPFIPSLPLPAPKEERPVAVKRNFIDNTTDFGGSYKELYMYKRLVHPFIVRLLSVSYGNPFDSCFSPPRYREYKDDKIHFVFEQASYDVHALIYDKRAPYSLLKFLMVHLLLAVEYSHSKCILHRDIKPGNMLVFEVRSDSRDEYMEQRQKAKISISSSDEELQRGLAEPRVQRDISVKSLLTQPENIDWRSIDRSVDKSFVGTNIPDRLTEKNIGDKISVENTRDRDITSKDTADRSIDTGVNIYLKLCDFGLAIPYTKQGNKTPRVVTGLYRAPEICLGHPYTAKIDIWSVGCVLYEMIARHVYINVPPALCDVDDYIVNVIFGTMPTSPTIQTLNKLFRYKQVQLTEVASPPRRMSMEKSIGLSEHDIAMFNSTAGSYAEFIDLLRHLLDIDPDERWTATQALGHPFFQSHRTIIEEVRGKYPPIPDPPEIISVRKCQEREWVANVAYNVFNNRYSSHISLWYSDRILFQALDIFDRYIVWLYDTYECTMSSGNMNTPNGNTHGYSPNSNTTYVHILSQYDTELYFLVCIYVAIKFFASTVAPISFSTLATEAYKTPMALSKADEFETILIRDVLKYFVYRDTVYEAADVFGDLLTENTVRELLIVYGRITSFSGMTAEDLYRVYKMV